MNQVNRVNLAWALMWIVVAVLAGTVATTMADGYRNPPEGAAALGRGGVRYVYGDDGSVLTHNPAGLTDLEAATLTFSSTFAYSPTEYTSAATGESEDSNVALAILPAIYGTMPLNEGRVVIGLGLTSPYGQASEWDQNGVFGGVAADLAEMTTINLSPSFGVKLCDSLSIGAGMNVMWANLEFQQTMVPPPGVPAPSSRLTAEGDGEGIGGTIGLVWQITEDQRLGVSYRTAMSLTCNGDVTADPSGVFVSPSDFETELNFPAVAALGYGIQVSDTVRLEADVEWIEHSCNDVLTLDLGANGALELDQDWDDTWTFGLGADWNCSEDWVLRTGCTWLPTPVPDSTFTPLLAEGDKYVLGVGAGYQSGAHKIDLAYSYSITEDRTIDAPDDPTAPDISGTYEMEPHLASLTYGYQF